VSSTFESDVTVAGAVQVLAAGATYWGRKQQQLRKKSQQKIKLVGQLFLLLFSSTASETTWSIKLPLLD
jgi:hypothetical protein